MTIVKLTLPMAMLVALTACLDSSSGVERSSTGVSNCPELGATAPHIMGNGVRCGPQSQLPYTLQ